MRVKNKLTKENRDWTETKRCTTHVSSEKIMENDGDDENNECVCGYRASRKPIFDLPGEVTVGVCGLGFRC